jgi:alpha-N-arabinofuranosidase
MELYPIQEQLNGIKLGERTMSGKLIHMYPFLLIVLCVTLLLAGCTKTIEIKGLRPTGEVRITVDACDIKGDISTMLTGVNMNFADDTDAMWADGSVAGYLSDVKAGILRYPGGAKTGHYHWEYPEVPKYMDAWDPAVDPNDYTSTTHMDTDEYIAWCGVIGAEPLLGINIQSGHKYNRIADSIAEAGRWVQYCKDKNYNVTYWYLDNELYYGHNADPITVEEYTAYIKQFVPEMRAVDPNIKIVVGWENKLSVERYWDDWEYLIEQANEYIDIADVHWYWAWGYATWDLWLDESPMTVREWCGDCPDEKYYGPSYVEDIQGFYDKIKDVNGISYDIKLAALEWNIAPVEDGRFSRFQHALMHAEMLGQYIEGGLHMASMWPLTWIGDIGNNFRAIIDQENHRPTPSFYVFKLYSNVLGQQLVTSQTSQVYIRPVSAMNKDGNTLWVYLLNKSSDGQAVNAKLDISGFTAGCAEAIALTAPELSSNVGKLKKLKVQVNSETGKWQSVLPPHSLTMLTFHKDK